MSTKKDPSAVSLGSKGGRANTPTQNKARAANAAKARAAKINLQHRKSKADSIAASIERSFPPLKIISTLAKAKKGSV